MGTTITPNLGGWTNDEGNSQSFSFQRKRNVPWDWEGLGSKWLIGLVACFLPSPCTFSILKFASVQTQECPVLKNTSPAYREDVRTCTLDHCISLKCCDYCITITSIRKLGLHVNYLKDNNWFTTCCIIRLSNQLLATIIYQRCAPAANMHVDMLLISIYLYTVYTTEEVVVGIRYTHCR